MLRTLIVLASLAAAVAFALEYREEDRCNDARSKAFVTRDAESIRTILDTCRGTSAKLSVAGALRAADRDAQALELAREAAEEEPDNAAAWRAVVALSEGSERSAARERLRELDPRSLKRRAGRSTR